MNYLTHYHKALLSLVLLTLLLAPTPAQASKLSCWLWNNCDSATIIEVTLGCGQTKTITLSGFFAPVLKKFLPTWYEARYGNKQCSNETLPKEKEAKKTTDTAPDINDTDSNNTGSFNLDSTCVSAANACGMTSIGTRVDGICNATAPSNLSCPLPQLTFYASPTQVRPNATSILYWSSLNATFCTLSGGGLSLSGLASSGSQQTNPIANETLYSLTCLDGVGGPSAMATIRIIILPTYKEI